MSKSKKITQYNEETLNYMLDVIKEHINKGKYQTEDQEEPQQEQPLSKPAKKQREGIECTKCGKVLNTASPAAIRIHQTSEYCNDNAKKVQQDSLAKRGHRSERSEQDTNKVRITPKQHPRLLSNK